MVHSTGSQRRILWTRHMAGAAAVLVVLALCGCGSGGSSESGAGALVHVTLRTDLTPNGKDAIHYYAEQLGYFKQEGISVSVTPSPNGSTAALDAVATGQVDFAYVDGGLTMQAIAAGKPVVAVASIMGKSLFGFFVSKNSPINSIKELAGKSVVVGSSGVSTMTASLKYIGVNPSSIKIVGVNSSAIIPIYEKGGQDAMWTTASLASEAEAVRPSKSLLIADEGLNTPGYVIVTNKKFLASHEDLVRKFVTADLKGALAAEKNPTAAIDALLKAYPQLNKKAELTTLETTFPFYCSASQKGHPYGWLAAKDFTNTANAYALHGSHDASAFETDELFTGSNALKVGTC